MYIPHFTTLNPKQHIRSDKIKPKFCFHPVSHAVRCRDVPQERPSLVIQHLLFTEIPLPFDTAAALTGHLLGLSRSVAVTVL